MKKLLKNKKLIIGMIHFPPLPGSPEFNDDSNLSNIIKSVTEDLESLQTNGIDAIMFGNEGDRPYTLKASDESLSTMAYVIGIIRNKIKIPFGVNYLWDPVATVALGCITNANFAREVFTGVYDSDMGLWQPNAAKALRLRANLKNTNLKLMFNVNAEFASPLGIRSTSEKAESAVFSSLADAICVSGVITGKAVNIIDLTETKNRVNPVPVFANTGVNINNIEDILKVSDGCVIGSSLKYDGVTWNNIDPERVSKFMQKVNNIRN
jgi:membrane complex biogenesis BtpA family protein